MLNSYDKKNDCNVFKLEPQSKLADKKMTRRRFFIDLGIGTGIFIAGYILGRESSSKIFGLTEPQPKADKKPNLRDDIVFGTDGELATIKLKNQKDQKLCAVNQTGAAILKRLDGKHTIEEISEYIATMGNCYRTEKMDANIACFVAQLGMLGFLTAPYYTQIIEREEWA